MALEREMRVNGAYSAKTQTDYDVFSPADATFKMMLECSRFTPE